MLEKLAILDTGLDDRIVEICKIFIQSEYQKQHPDCGHIELLMYNDSNKHIIQVLEDGKTAGCTRLSDEMYNAIKEHYTPRLKDIRDEDEPVIGQA